MGWKRMLPTFSTFVKRVFDGCQKLFWLFSKALVTVVKNYQNITFLLSHFFLVIPLLVSLFFVTLPKEIKMVAI